MEQCLHSAVKRIREQKSELLSLQSILYFHNEIFSSHENNASFIEHQMFQMQTNEQSSHLLRNHDNIFMS